MIYNTCFQYVFTFLKVHLLIRMCACVCVCLCVCICVCVHVYTQTHTHMHTYICVCVCVFNHVGYNVNFTDDVFIKSVCTHLL